MASSVLPATLNGPIDTEATVPRQPAAAVGAPALAPAPIGAPVTPTGASAEGPLCVLCRAAAPAPGRQRCESCLMCQRCRVVPAAPRQRMCEGCGVAVAQAGAANPPPAVNPALAGPSNAASNPQAASVTANQLCAICKANAVIPGRHRCQSCLTCQKCQKRPAASMQKFCSECLVAQAPSNATPAAPHSSHKSGGGFVGFMKNPFGIFGKHHDKSKPQDAAAAPAPAAVQQPRGAAPAGAPVPPMVAAGGAPSAQPALPPLPRQQ